MIVKALLSSFDLTITLCRNQTQLMDEREVLRVNWAFPNVSCLVLNEYFQSEMSDGSLLFFLTK